MRGKSGRRERGGSRSSRPASSWVYPFEVRRVVVQEIVERHAALSLVSKTFGIAEMTIRNWLVAFQLGGEQALVPKSSGRPTRPRDSSDPVVAAVLALKHQNPEYGARRIRDVVQRFEALGVSSTKVRQILAEAGLVTPAVPGPIDRGERPPRRFERAAPNQLWQSDIFTFLLRRHERLYLTAFMDDHSRFLVSFVLAHHQKGSLVLEALERGVASFGTPEEVLTDQGRQYTAWRGETLFEERLRQYGIRHLKSRPQHPETLGKVERFWKTLWDEFLSRTVFADFADCQRRLGLFVEGYNFQRPHQALDGLVPADRYFRAAPQVRAAIEKNIEGNALRRAQQQPAQKPFYLVGRLGDRDLSIAADGPGLRVRMGNELPQTITLQKERADEEQAIPNRIRYPKEGNQVAPDATVAAYEHRVESDRAAEMHPAAQRAVGREVGERSDLRNADLPGHVLQVGDRGLGRDVVGSDPRGGERYGGGWDAGRPVEGTGGEGEDPGAGQTAGGAAVATDTQGGKAGASEDGRGEAPGEPQRGKESASNEEGVAELDPDTAARIERAFDPDEGWRQRAETWERKLTGALAPSVTVGAEDTHSPPGEEETELRAGTGSPETDAGAFPNDPGGDAGKAGGDRGSQTAGHEPQSLPDAPASSGEGNVAVHHSQAGGPATNTDPGSRASGGALTAREGESDVEDAQRSGGEASYLGWGLGTWNDRSAGPPSEDSEDEDSAQ
jgi:transposase InsO family protein